MTLSIGKTAVLAGGVALFAAVSAPAQAGAKTLRVDTRSDTADRNPGDGRCRDPQGDCSLRAAVQEANARGGGDRIDLRKKKTYNLRRDGAAEDAAATGDLDVTSKIKLRGRGATVDAKSLDRAFDVTSDGKLTLNDLTVNGGAAPEGESGGAVRSTGRLTVRRSKLASNRVTGTGASGGAIASDQGRLRVLRTRIARNTSVRAGGAIEANIGRTSLNRATLTRNRTGSEPGNGGGLHLTGAGTVKVKKSRVTLNRAEAEGGGLWNSSTGTMRIRDTKFGSNTAAGNDADQGGGAVYNDGGPLRIDDSRVKNNQATGTSGSGGGILNSQGDLRVSETKIDLNAANRAGGGIEANIGTTSLDDVRLIRNRTESNPGNGGGLHLTGAGTVTVEGGRVLLNRASAEGGGLWNPATGAMTVSDVKFGSNTASGNDADQGGGALFNDGGSLTVDGSRIKNNQATGTSGSGGGILNNGGDLTVSDTTIELGQSARAGGGIEANVGTTSLTGVTLKDNQTGAGPGNGGGLHLTGAGTVTISGGSVTGNKAANEGGGLWSSATGMTTVTGTTIRDNTAPTGPDTFNDGGVFTVDGTPVLPTP